MKKIALFALKTLPVVLIFLWLFYRAASGEDFERLLTRQKDWGMLLAAFGLALVATVLTMIRWQWLVRALGVELSLREALRLGFIGFVLNLSPMGIVGGDLVKGVLLAKKSPQYKAACAVSVIADRVIGLYVMFLIGLAAVFGSGFYRNPAPAAVFGSRAMIALTAVSTAGVLFLLYPSHGSFSADPAKPLPFSEGKRGKRWNKSKGSSKIPASPSGFRQRLIRKIPLLGGVFEKLFVATTLYRSRTGTLAASFLVTFAVHALFALSLWSIAIGLFSFAPSPCDHLVIYPIANCGSMIPLSAGPLEYFLDELYPLFEIIGHAPCEKGYGLMVGVAYRLITILIAALGGVYCLTARSEISAALNEINEEKAQKKK